MLDAVCTYVSLDDLMSKRLNASCGKPAVKFYSAIDKIRRNKPLYFARCKDHDKPGDNPHRAPAEEVSWQEYAVHQVMES